MAETFRFELVSPERVLVSADVAEVIVPGAEGEFTVLPRHAPLIAMLRPGILRIPGMDGKLSEIYLRGGLADVGPDRLTILAEQARPVADIDRALIDQEIRNAEEDLADAEDEDKKRQAAETLEQLRSLSDVLTQAA
ncbi:MAG: F0F1 ATP synthase subunit epsilon [Rhodomicrobium sp.]|nr:F0F1 ATP synthase subunit epsilon [Rhodomicrobium sp.]